MALHKKKKKRHTLTNTSQHHMDGNQYQYISDELGSCKTLDTYAREIKGKKSANLVEFL